MCIQSLLGFTLLVTLIAVKFSVRSYSCIHLVYDCSIRVFRLPYLRTVITERQEITLQQSFCILPECYRVYYKQAVHICRSNSECNLLWLCMYNHFDKKKQSSFDCFHLNTKSKVSHSDPFSKPCYFYIQILLVNFAMSVKQNCE